MGSEMCIRDRDQIMRAIGKAAGAEPDIIHISSEFIAMFNPDEGDSLLGDKAYSAVFDNSKIKTFVPGYLATMPFVEGVKKTIDYFEAHPKMCAVDKEYNKFMDTVIDSYKKGFPK